MLEQLGDCFAFQLDAEPSDDSFRDVLQTTWRELRDDDGLIHDQHSVFGKPRFTLTAHGWLRAMMWSGEVDSAETRERSTALAKALKATVKGRASHYDSLVSLRDLASASSLPQGWVCNAIEARLLSVVFPNDRWDAAYEKRMIRVSPTIGLNHLFEGDEV